MSATTLNLRQPDTHEPTSGRSYPLSVSSGWVSGKCTLYNADCRDVLPTLGPVDAVITDPPYGIKQDAGMGGGGGMPPDLARLLNKKK